MPKRPGEVSGCFANFSSFPPSRGKGVVHPTQIAGHSEPALGSTWELVMTHVGNYLTGASPAVIQVTGAGPHRLPAKPSLFGWTGDGAFENGCKLQAILAVALGLARVPGEPPESLGEWIKSLGAISVCYVAHATPSSRIIASWKETMVKWKTNVKLTPTMCVKSLCKYGVKEPADIDRLARSFDAAMTVVDPSLRPQGRMKERTKRFMSQTSVPPETFQALESYFSGRRYEDAVAFRGLGV